MKLIMENWRGYQKDKDALEENILDESMIEKLKSAGAGAVYTFLDNAIQVLGLSGFGEYLKDRIEKNPQLLAQIEILTAPLRTGEDAPAQLSEHTEKEQKP